MARKTTAAAPAVGEPEKGALDSLIKATMDEVLELKEKKAEISASIAAEKAALEARGITRGAFNRAMRDYEKHLADEENEGLLATQDDEYAVCREALGIPLHAVQGSLFGGDKEDGEEDDDPRPDFLKRRHAEMETEPAREAAE